MIMLNLAPRKEYVLFFIVYYRCDNMLRFPCIPMKNLSFIPEAYLNFINQIAVFNSYGNNKILMIF